MGTLIAIMQGVVERGCLFALVVTAVFLTSRIIKFDDLSVEGSFGLGGALAAACAAQGISIVLSIPLAVLGGCLAGLATGLLHIRLQLNNLISGIIVTTGLFSVCLKLSSPNLMIASEQALFSGIPHKILV